MLERGTVIEGYRIVGEIGTGSMGLVYLAKQISMDRTIAMKVLDPTRAAVSEEHGRMFVNEARGAASLNHPNIVAIHDAGSTLHDGRLLHYFTMEYVDGENLLDLIGRDEVVAGDDLKRIASGIVAALTYAAGKNIVHRDIKPANIMLTPQREVKLADFGLVSFEDDAFVGKVVGTPRYMSPEQARGLAVDHTADQYSFGCLLYHMLTGEAPYSGANRKEILKKQKHAPIPDPRDMVDCSDAWAELCMQLMAKNPAERFPQPQELAERVQEICQADDDPRPSRRLRPRGRQTSRRNAGRKTRPTRRGSARESTRREQREAPRRDTRQRGRGTEARGGDRPRRPTRPSASSAAPPTPRPPAAETERPPAPSTDNKHPARQPPPPLPEELDDSLILGEALDDADAQRQQTDPPNRQRRRESATAPPTDRHHRRRPTGRQPAGGQAERGPEAPTPRPPTRQETPPPASPEEAPEQAEARRTSAQPDPTDASSLDSSIHEPNRLLAACRDAIGTAWDWSKLWGRRAVIAGWRATRWLVGRGIAALPVIRRIAYRLVTPTARLTYLLSGLTWRIRVVSGRSHLLTAHDAGWTLVAGCLDGRHLPFVWYRLHIEGWRPWRALFGADWWRRYWRHLRGRAQGYLANPQQRTDRQRRLLAACRDDDEPISLSVDRERRGHLSPSFLAAVSAEGSTVIPLAIASTPGWLFRHSRQHHLIPPPFATIHIAVGEPVHFHNDDEDPDATGARLMADIIELQSYLDHLAHMQDPDGLVDEDEVVEEMDEDGDEETDEDGDDRSDDDADDDDQAAGDESDAPTDEQQSPTVTNADEVASVAATDQATTDSETDADINRSDSDVPATTDEAVADTDDHRTAENDERPRSD